jgi:hypothetical protein
VPAPAQKGKKAKGGNSLYDLLDEGDIGEDDGGGGLLVSSTHDLLASLSYLRLII